MAKKKKLGRPKGSKNKATKKKRKYKKRVKKKAVKKKRKRRAKKAPAEVDPTAFEHVNNAVASLTAEEESLASRLEKVRAAKAQLLEID
jgi:hypothetical protein